MSRIVPGQIVRASIQLEGQCALDTSLTFGKVFVWLVGCFCFYVFEAILIYEQPKRLKSRCMGLDSNAIQVRSGEHYKRKNLKRNEVDIIVKLLFVRGNIIRERKEHAGKLCSI